PTDPTDPIIEDPTDEPTADDEAGFSFYEIIISFSFIMVLVASKRKIKK
ncbi:MAG: hypothetical protein H7643_06395, partial [Candidatus Heimdallarchaeota archaeon]|nr:hypothetical protein [Candidatus Heimdallarchaeota archaeon]